ncbi:hypothetical protein DYB25_004755 [Aphanomyces astaci]|uniref:Uncharacterized protein n=1 Tax=Aphanomyces astaci TaxID=112090 RepID=A0A397EVJ5_APHAT|nr:hypothetical protein DYB25_004755 [Aphanomyces astaci]RHY01456.1 hypothetical protein DYB36_008746 [Aphanomyces astaci]RHY38377.1 hypothetical protein DYB38_008872 [Aphanomyces astaci]RHY40089.1 hypothetical protein DYB34_005319 [Aphanomyces astaci]RHY56411.1 hypothetical protein DYB30_006805 [Aphanomyces astaci]
MSYHGYICHLYTHTHLRLNILVTRPALRSISLTECHYSNSTYSTTTMKSFSLAVGVVLSSAAAVVTADNGSQCTLSIAKAVVPHFTSPVAKACAKVIGGTDMTPVFTTTTSSSDQAKLLASADCSKWYDAIASAIKGVSPPCTYIAGDSPVYETDKLNWTFKEFLAKNNEVGEINAASTPAPTTTSSSVKPIVTTKPANVTSNTTTKSPDANVTSSTTTKSPDANVTSSTTTKSPGANATSNTTTTAAPTVTASASVSAAGAVVLAVAAYMAN